MEIRYFDIKGIFELIPDVFHDERGSFFESYNQDKFLEKGFELSFVQDNQSFSKKHVLRGLHFQREPYGQGKLIRVIGGKALDVAVDIRPGSPTFGKHVSCMLDGAKNNMLFIPEGLAHGFITLEDTILLYKCTRTYRKGDDAGIVWNDPELAIDWGIKNPILSEKDKHLPGFKTYRDSLFRGNSKSNPSR